MAPRTVPTIDFESLHRAPWLVRLNERLQHSRFGIDRSITKEIKRMAAHHTEAYRTDGTRAPRLPTVRTHEDLLGLQQQNAECLAHRDRVTEILISYTEVQYGLNALWEQATAQLLSTEQYRNLTNDTARRAFCIALLGTLHERKAHVEKVLEMCKLLQEHLSHTHFTIKQHTEMGVAYLAQRSA